MEKSMKTHFETVKKMAANRGLVNIVSLAEEALGLCKKIRHAAEMAPYDGSRNACESAQAQTRRDTRIDACNARISEIMAITNSDQSWLTAPSRQS